ALMKSINQLEQWVATCKRTGCDNLGDRIPKADVAIAEAKLKGLRKEYNRSVHREKDLANVEFTEEMKKAVLDRDHKLFWALTKRLRGNPSRAPHCTAFLDEDGELVTDPVEAL